MSNGNDLFKLITGELREEIARRMGLEIEVRQLRDDALKGEIEELRERIRDLEQYTLLEKEKLRR